MLNMKNEKGSITLFVLVSAMFFVASIAGINFNLQSREIAIDKEYRNIKSNYEQDIDNLEAIYQDLSLKDSIEDMEAEFSYPDIEQNEDEITISQQVKIDYNKYNIKKIGYAWIYSENSLTSSDLLNEQPTEWIYTELANSLTAIYKDEYAEGYYYLCLLVNNKMGSEKVIWADKVAVVN